MGQQGLTKAKKGQPGAKARKQPLKKVVSTVPALNPLSFTPLLLAIDQLKPHPRNYRVHPPDQIAHLKQSITEHGFYRNVVVANDYTLLAGHGSWQAARELGFAQIPVIVLNVGPNDPRAMKVLVGDNEIEHLADQDDRLLTDLLKEIKATADTALTGTGYDDLMLANLVYVTRPKSEMPTFDAAAHWAGMPDFGDTKVDKELPKLTITFRTEAEREQFCQQAQITLLKRGDLAWSAWWPPKDIMDWKAIKFVVPSHA